jgi:hypothetical protein
MGGCLAWCSCVKTSGAHRSCGQQRTCVLRGLFIVLQTGTPGDATVEVHVYRTRAKLLSGLGAMRRQTPGEYYIVGRDRATWGAVFNMGQINLPPVYVMNALGGDPLP